MLDEAFAARVLHEAAFIFTQVEDEDIREGVLLLAKEVLLEEADHDVAMMVLRHAVNGVY